MEGRKMLHRRLVLSLVFVVASSALFASGATEQKAISDELIDDIVSCKPLLSVVLDSNHGEFVDTKSEDKDEILKKGWDSEEIYVHLTKLIHKGKVLPPSLESIRRIAKYHTCFLLSGEKYSRQILFGGDDFDVLGRLRLIIALPPPPGYAFVKDDSIMVLPNKMELSPAETSLKGGTERPGATLLIRYIQLRGDVYDKIDKDDRAYAILSHELTHAYVNALMGWDNIQKLPEWFHEGFATYMGGNKPYESKHVFQPSAG